MNHSSTLQYLRLSLLIWVFFSVLAGNTGLSAETQTLLDMRIDESGELVVIFDESRIVRTDDFLGDRVLYSSTDLKDWQEEARFPADFNLKEYRTGFEAGALTLFFRMGFEGPEPPDTVLVRFVDDPSPEEVQELLEVAGLVSPVGILQTPLMTAQGDAPWIEFRATHGPAAAVNTLLASPVVEAAMVSDYLHALFVSNDPYFLEGKLWGMQSAEAGSGAEAAWAAGHTGSKEVVIAVLDTGLQLDHPDIVANLWTNPWEIAGNGIDDTGNGYIDDVHGWDFVNNRPITGDLSSHGTHVAGTVGAEGGNALGVVGVAWNLKILPVIFLGPDGLGTYDNAARAYDYKTVPGRGHGRIGLVCGPGCFHQF